MASRSFTPALEAHSQAEAGEELPLRGIEVLEIGRQVLVLAALITHFTVSRRPTGSCLH